MNGTFFFAIVDPFFPTFQRTAGDTKEFFLNLLKKHPYNQLEKISYKTSIHILMGNWHFTGKPLKKKTRTMATSSHETQYFWPRPNNSLFFSGSLFWGQFSPFHMDKFAAKENNVFYCYIPIHLDSVTGSFQFRLTAL